MQLKKISTNVFEIPKSGEMLVPARIYGNEKIIKAVLDEEKEKPDWNSLQQLRNTASLPGVRKYSIALADVHCGYGAPIGSVVATDFKEGVIAFGTIGYDINCGVHSMILPLSIKEVEEKKKELAEVLYKEIPAGLGVDGKLRLNKSEIDEVLVNGANYAVKKGFGFKEDLLFIEDNGRLKGVNVNDVSDKAKERALNQIGTLGSGNHYCEVQEVEKIFDEEAGKAFGLEEKGVIVSIHCGSRALGHQIGADYIPVLEKAVEKYGIKISDKEMACAPIQSEEGQKFLSAVNAGINSAFCNRQVIGELVRRSVSKVFEVSEKEIKTLYDVGHNTAKIEKHEIEGKMQKLLVQRKGSTRGFGPNIEEIPEKYRKVGQPIIVGGSMGTNSFILKGTEKAMQETFGSTIHGAGRSLSRTKAMQGFSGQSILQELLQKGIIVKAHSTKGLAEEAPQAYKDVVEVVQVMHNAGISQKVAKLKPIICIKG